MNRTFEECYKEIDEVVEKLRPKWIFKASMMTDFEDVKIEIITHIWKKWDKYDQSRSLGGWVCRVSRNKFINMLRDTYASTSSPCSNCAANKGEGLCSVYTVQCEECPLYKKWYHGKRYAHNARLPISIDNENYALSEVQGSEAKDFCFDKASNTLHKRMREVLTDSEWEIYKRLNIEHKSEEQVAKELNMTTNEEGRNPGYRRIRQVKTIIFAKAKQILKTHGVEEI